MITLHTHTHTHTLHNSIYMYIHVYIYISPMGIPLNLLHVCSSFEIFSVPDDPIVIPESEGSPEPPPYSDQNSPIRTSLVQGPPTSLEGNSPTTPMQGMVQEGLLHVRKSPISSRTRSRARPEGVPSGNGATSQPSRDAVPNVLSWTMRPSSTPAATSSGHVATAASAGGLAYHLPPASSLTASHPLSCVPPSLPLSSVSPSHHMTSVSPSHHMSSVSPSHHMGSVSPSHHMPSVSPPHHMPSVSPSHHMTSVSPSHHMSSVSPSHHMSSVSPISSVSSPTDQRYQTLPGQPMFPVSVATSSEQQVYRVIDSSTGCSVVLPLPLNQQVITTNVNVGSSSASLAQLLPIIPQSITAAPPAASVNQRAINQGADPRFSLARYVIRPPTDPPPYPHSSPHTPSPLHPLPLSAVVKPNLRRAQSLSFYSQSTPQPTISSLALVEGSKSAGFSGGVSLKGSVDSPIVIEDVEEPLGRADVEREGEREGEKGGRDTEGEREGETEGETEGERERETEGEIEREKEEEREGEREGFVCETAGHESQIVISETEEEAEKPDKERGVEKMNAGAVLATGQHGPTVGGSEGDVTVAKDKTGNLSSVESTEEEPMEVATSEPGEDGGLRGGVSMVAKLPEEHCLSEAHTTISGVENRVVDSQSISGATGESVAVNGESDSLSESCEPGPLVQPDGAAPANYDRNEPAIDTNSRRTESVPNETTVETDHQTHTRVEGSGSSDSSKGADESETDSRREIEETVEPATTTEGEGESENSAGVETSQSAIGGNKSDHDKTSVEPEVSVTNEGEGESPVRNLEEILVQPETPTDAMCDAAVSSPRNATPGGILKHTSQFDTPTSTSARMRRVQFASSPVVFQPSKTGNKGTKTPRHCESVSEMEAVYVYVWSDIGFYSVHCFGILSCVCVCVCVCVCFSSE